MLFFGFLGRESEKWTQNYKKFFGVDPSCDLPDLKLTTEVVRS